MDSRHPLIARLTLFTCFFYALLFSSLSQAANDKAFLWKASSGTTHVYLMGSIHVAKPDVYPLRPAIEQAYQASDNLVVEADLNPASMQLIQQLMLTRGMYTAGETIRDHISDDTYQALVSFLRDNNLPVINFLQYKPGLLVLTLTSLQFMQKGLSPEHGIDLHFTQQARGKKPILELESAAYQIELMLNLPDQEAMLKQTLDEFGQYDELIRLLDQYWRTGDAEQLSQLMIEEPLKEYPESKPIIQAMFFDRNHNMTRKIETYLQSKETYFVVVGAGHLIGPQSIIELLQQAGYQLERL